jgi:hypothetical protein
VLQESRHSTIGQTSLGGASNDLKPNLQNPKNPLPYDPIKLPKTVETGGGGQTTRRNQAVLS